MRLKQVEEFVLLFCLPVFGRLCGSLIGQVPYDLQTGLNHQACVPAIRFKLSRFLGRGAWSRRIRSVDTSWTYHSSFSANQHSNRPFSNFAKEERLRSSLFGARLFQL